MPQARFEPPLVVTLLMKQTLYQPSRGGLVGRADTLSVVCNQQKIEGGTVKIKLTDISKS